MKKIIIILITILFSASIYSQERNDTLWTFNGLTSINFSQMSLSNWAAGGEDSYSANGMVNLNANYLGPWKKKSWTNELVLGYGLLRQGETAVRKSNDKIDLATKLGYKASKRWYYSGLFSFKTQFSAGYSNPGDIVNREVISNFLAPGYLNLSLGMDFLPNKNFTMLLAPITGKMTLVMDDALASKGSFGVDAGKNMRSEFGGYIKIAYTKEIVKNIKVNTKIDLFSNYIDNPQYVDVNFDFLLSFKVNEYISASFISQLIYDHDILFDVLGADGNPTGEKESKVQFKELFGIGLTYSF